MCFEDSWNDRDYSGRAWGFCVRPVCGENKLPLVNYTLTVSASVGGSASIRGYAETTVQLLPDESMTVIATADEGYVFTGWYHGDSENLVSSDAEYRVTAEKSLFLKARFEEK